MATTLATRRQYRGWGKKSLCRKKTVRKCRKVRGCKNTKKTAKKPRYCRKKHNKHLKQKGGAPGDRMKNFRNMLERIDFEALDVPEAAPLPFPDIQPPAPINNHEQCFNKCNNDFTAGKITDSGHRNCKRACLAAGGRRTRRRGHTKTRKTRSKARVTDARGVWHSVDMPSVSPSMRKEIKDECREKCHGRNRKQCRDRCRRRLLDRAVEAQFGGKSVSCYDECMEKKKVLEKRPSKSVAMRECRDRCSNQGVLQRPAQVRPLIVGDIPVENQ